MTVLALVLVAGLAANAEMVRNRAPLQPRAFDPLPLGSVKAKGWLARQLRIQADGLTGRLDEFWPSVGPDSGWLGGQGESWERGPYYMDGLVPLAYLLNDARLIEKSKKWVAWTLANQRPDGAIGPVKNTDWWPNFVMLKVLAQYQEATGDERVIPLMRRYVAYQLKHIDERPLAKWAAYRWADEVVALVWLYNRTGDAAAIDLARKMARQGYDWKSHFAEFKYRDKMTKDQTNYGTHVVNNAMAIKTSPVWWQVSGAKSDREALYQLFGEMDRYHLMPNGAHSGDEHYAGRDPSQGTELCAVVEAMYSIEHAVAILGDAALADRLEKLAFNALPGTFDAKMWAHQYDQQPNQVLCTRHPRAWTNNGPDSNLFGLEPNFGCCTANYHQGWPKLVTSLWMATPDGGLAAAAYGPSEVRTTVGGNIPVTITEDTEYPFRGKVVFTVNPERAATWPLVVRIPAWAAGTKITVGGSRSTVSETGWRRIERRWKAGDRVEIEFPMAVRTSRWFNDSLAFERGPLVFSLKVGEDWRKLRTIGPATDWEVYPTTPWNYGVLPGSHPEAAEKPVGDYPFSPDGAPVELHVQGRKLPAWELVNGSAATVPQSPVKSTEALEMLTLVPYGSAKLRITAFPVLEK
ncbi:MAG TPA: beta-L-arabinofuranosidase domain-containing protein [Bryobacteraceae bacterium]|nr:beta-L-arabinofuranosidase domain-containing protein [Bryobacteraceae bacterium]